MNLLKNIVKEQGIVDMISTIKEEMELIEKFETLINKYTTYNLLTYSFGLFERKEITEDEYYNFSNGKRTDIRTDWDGILYHMNSDIFKIPQEYIKKQIVKCIGGKVFYNQKLFDEDIAEYLNFKLKLGMIKEFPIQFKDRYD